MQEAESAAVAPAREGREETCRRLVQAHSRSLFRLAFRITGNEHDAEDVVQEALFRAFRHMDRYESRASLSTWVHRIAANCALDLIRRRKRRQEESEVPPVAAADPGPDRLVYSGQVQKYVADAMNELSAQERAAFVLRHFEGESIEEIGRALGLNESAAKHSVFRAVQKLRRWLAPVVGSEL
jgi:RNA polymerase sigma-70 factor (ECF subfamily)